MTTGTAPKHQPNQPQQTVIHPADDPQIGNLATPINASGLTLAWVSNLPAYRKGLTAFRRGLEVGMAHGYWLLGPFVKLGPQRNEAIANLAGLLSTVGLIIIATAAITLYACSNPPAPIATITTPTPPEDLKTAKGWEQFGVGFGVGGIGGAVFAYVVLLGLSWL